MRSWIAKLDRLVPQASDSDLADQQRSFEVFIVQAAIAALGFAAAFMLLAVAFSYPRLSIAALALVGYGAYALVTLRRLRRGRIAESALGMTLIGLWLCIVTVLAVPGLYPLVVGTAMGSAIVGAAHLRIRPLLACCAATFATIVAAVAWGTRASVDPLPRTLDVVANGGGLVTVGYLSMFLIVDFASRLRRSLDRERDMHARLSKEKEHTHQAYELARNADRRKDEFLALLGHELRNPLSPIVTALELMRQRAPEAFLRERAVIERQVNHLVRLVDDLLDISRIVTGKVRLQRERVLLSRVLADAVEMTASLVAARRHRLEVTGDTDAVLDADPVRLAQVLANLLDNAAKYTAPGGHIDVQVSRAEEEVRIDVKDSGTGIPPEMLPRLFEPFVQGAQTLARSRGGMGLGLALTKGLVELHGGRVRAASAGTGQGSTFTVWLPAQVGKSPVPERPRELTTYTTDRGARVLVVDDNHDAAETTAALLRQAEWEVMVAYDGEQALEAFATFQPEAAVVDIGLPLINGFEVCRRVRAQQGERNVRIVAITGYGQQRDQEESRAAGFDTHLVKPVSRNSLLAALRGGAPAGDLRHTAR